MANIENSESVIYETTKTIEFVKANWADPVGNQYVYWLEQTLEKLKQLERHREVMQLKAKKVALLCEQVSSTDDDPPKVLKKTR